MTELLPLSIGVGLVVSLIFSELFGLAAGGLVVPGYFALHLMHPLDVALTLLVSLATFGIVRTLSSFVIIFGRRRTVMMVLIGYILGAVTRSWIYSSGFATAFIPPDWNLAIIGFIVPGLIAIWLDRQGVIETLATLLTASVIVRLILILIVGVELNS